MINLRGVYFNEFRVGLGLVASFVELDPLVEFDMLFMQDLLEFGWHDVLWDLVFLLNLDDVLFQFGKVGISIEFLCLQKFHFLA